MSRFNVDHGTLATIDGRRVSFGSVEGYAKQYREDPAAALDHAIRNGHELYWANLEAAVLCSDPGHFLRDQDTWGNVPAMRTGDTVVFPDGAALVIEPAHNRNFNLIFIEYAA